MSEPAAEPNLMELVERYADEETARATFERLRWPNGTVCPRCGVHGESHRMRSAASSKTRKGLWYCTACKGQFTVTVGTLLEDSHIKIGKWLTAFHLMAASKKGMSAHQLHRMLGVTYKSAWFMAHRIRFAMTQTPMAELLKGIVEADETYVGGKPENMHAERRTPAPRRSRCCPWSSAVVTCAPRSWPDATGKTLAAAIRKTVAKNAVITSDGHKSYVGLRKEYAGHPRWTPQIRP
jgi:transposase-like protein